MGANTGIKSDGGETRLEREKEKLREEMGELETAKKGSERLLERECKKEKERSQGE